MIKSKFVVIALVGALAMCIGLTACSSGSASSSAASSSAASSAAASSSAASSSAASSSAASSSAASNEILYWEGTLTDGSIVDYEDDWLNSLAALSIAKSDYSDAKVWYGPASIDEAGVVTITDAETSGTVSFTLSKNASGAMVIDIANYGEAELKAITEADFNAFVEKVASSPGP